MQIPELQRYALNAIWEMIAPDVLECAEEQEMSRDEVIEMVLDADRPTTFFPDIDWTAFYSVNYAERVKMCREQVFKDDIYGW